MCSLRCRYCVKNNTKLCCSASNMKEVGECVVKTYKRIGQVNTENWYYGYGVNPEWCPLIELEKMITDFKKGYNNLLKSLNNISVEVKKTESQKIDDEKMLEKNPITISFTCKTYYTDKHGRTILDSVDNADIVFDDLCNDENKKAQIIEFLNSNCKTSSFYIDKNYGIHCIEKDEKAIDIKIETKEESLPEYINFIDVPGTFSIGGGNLKTLKGCPKYVGFGFDCSSNKLKTLEYAPEIINYKEKEENREIDVNFNCSYNLIESFENCPTVKKGSIICNKNKIKTFKGIQEIIDGSLYCQDNEIDSFDYLPKIKMTFNASGNLFENIDEKEIKNITGCTNVIIKWCDEKIKRTNLTKEFLKNAIMKYGKDDFEFKYNTYFGKEPTKLTSKNGKIMVTCKRHNLSFETYPQEFLNGNKLCPICRMEKYNFKKHDKNQYKERARGEQDKEIYVSLLCKNDEIVEKIISFINSNITPDIYYAYYINEDYTIDIEPGYEYGWQGLNNPYKGVCVTVENKDIPNYIKFGEVVVSRFILTSKKWNQETEKYIQNKKIESFNGCPRRIFGDFICKNENISSFIGMPSFIGGVFDMSDNTFDDDAWEYAKKHIESDFGDYKISNNKFVKYRKELY